MPACKNCNQPFTIYPEDIKFYGKIGVPEPTWCPRCRMMRRLCWRNSRSIYKRKCDSCGAEMISIFSPEKKLKVYCHRCWWSDNWSALDYGRDFDFSRPFGEQFKELISATPHLGVNNEDSVNSEYTNLGYRNSNCYMCFGSDLSENCYYAVDSIKSRDCFDLYFCSNLELCSGCVDCHQSYDTHFCQESENLQSCYFSYDCRNCSHCFGSAGLRNKEYYFLNQAFSEAEWQKQVAAYFKTKTVKEIYTAVKPVWLAAPRRANVMTKADGCTGNHLRNCFKVADSFDCIEAENCRYLGHTIPKVKDSLDVYGSGAQGELMYEYITGFGYRVMFSSLGYKAARDIAYCFVAPGCHDCFGCASLRHQDYCILNKKYAPAEYFKLKEKIIEHMKTTGEWGEFFNPQDSPYGYNESEANDFFPLTKAEALAKGYPWREDGQPDYHEADPTNHIYGCQTCRRLFKIVKQELDFYQKQNLPLPVDCYKCRFRFLFKLRNPYKLWQRTCAKCGQGIETTYPPRLANSSGEAGAPERPEKVYCEECYRKEIY
ncbi:MAG: hypothetical protein WCT37_03855 [Patescibacteria group bacterium]|jgi:DNA-directed RNA polymerase subunit RPC12/RpoP